jgi:PAS domain S-box-containing protein
MLQNPRLQIQRKLAGAHDLRRWIGFAGLAIAVGAAYFLAARLSLLLLTRNGVAVFWPAAGISAGALIALGRQARWPVAVGMTAANMAASLMGGWSVWSSIYLALCDAGETLLVAWLIESYFGSPFSLGRLSQVLGFLAAAVAATAASGLGGAIGYTLARAPSEPFWITWQQWFASDVIGIATVAPLILGLASARHAPPPRRELAEGVGSLLAITLTTGLIILKLPTTWWDIDVIVVLLLPLLLWPAARCRPVFSAAAVFIVSVMIVAALTFDIGHFNAAFPSGDEVALTAQVGVVGVTLYALILASLFAERRWHVAELTASETSLQEALAAGGVLTFEWDVATDRVRRSNNAPQIFGSDAQRSATGASFFARLHPDDRARYIAFANGLDRDHPSFSITYRFIRSDGREVWFEENSKAEFDADGRLAGITGLVLDITERRRAEEQQTALMAELRDREDRMRAIVNTVVDGIITIDEKGIIDNVNPAAARAFGYAPEDVIGRNIKMLMPDPYCGEHDQYLMNYLTTGQAKIIGIGREVAGRRKDGSIFPIELAVGEMAATGRRMFTGVVRDITRRRLAEERQRLLIAELDHRVKNVLARVAAVADSTGDVSSSIDGFIRALKGRIRSMAAAHELLSQSGWQGVGLTTLVHNQLAPYATDENVTIGGTDVVLSAPATQAVAMVLHELVTNAAKYGALSSPSGRVSIGWERKANGAAAAMLSLEWRERDGPPVAAEVRSGYGTDLIRDLIPHELGGTVDLAFAPDGACCRIEIPLRQK